MYAFTSIYVLSQRRQLKIEAMVMRVLRICIMTVSYREVFCRAQATQQNSQLSLLLAEQACCVQKTNEVKDISEFVLCMCLCIVSMMF